MRNNDVIKRFMLEGGFKENIDNSDEPDAKNINKYRYFLYSCARVVIKKIV